MSGADSIPTGTPGRSPSLGSSALERLGAIGRVVLEQRNAGGSDQGPGRAPFEVRVAPDREAVHVIPVGELDIATATRLKEELDQLIGAGFAHVVIDLRELRFIDSTGLRVLLAAHADSQRDGWRLSLIPGLEPVERLFALTSTRDTLPFISADALLAEEAGGRSAHPPARDGDGPQSAG